MSGKNRRLNRLLIGPHKRCLLIPLDHGPWLGPVAGIERPREIVGQVLAGGANALLVTPGFLREVQDILPPGIGIILRVSPSAGLSKQALQEVPAFTATTAVRYDADAVAVSIFFGRGGEVEIMRWLGQLIEECYGYDIPVVAEMMPPADKSYDADYIAHAARIGLELGADIIKTNYCGNVESFKQVVASIQLPILIAGGPSQEGDGSTLQVACDAMQSGAAGVAFGRRVWQAADPCSLVQKLYKIVLSPE